MPFSLDPQPKEDEIECARCGALIYYKLTRCPECGVNLYEQKDEFDQEYFDGFQESIHRYKSIFSWIREIFKRLTGSPYSIEEVFGTELDQAYLYSQLLTRVGGDRQLVDRLIQFEQQHTQDGSHYLWLKKALDRWERDNDSSS